MYIEHLGTGLHCQRYRWEVNNDWLWTYERDRHKPKLCSPKVDQGDGYTRAQEASRAQRKGRYSGRAIYKHETKGMQSVDFRSEKAAGFPHNVRASWGDSEVLRTRLTPFLLAPESCPWTPTPQFGPRLPVVNQVPQMVPACMHRSSSIVHDRFLF